MNELKTREQAVSRGECAIKELYGHHVTELSIDKVEHYPLFKEPKEGFLVLASFRDEDGKYTIQMEFTFDGNLKRIQEVGRE